MSVEDDSEAEVVDWLRGKSTEIVGKPPDVDPWDVEVPDVVSVDEVSVGVGDDVVGSAALEVELSLGVAVSEVGCGSEDVDVDSCVDDWVAELSDPVMEGTDIDGATMSSGVELFSASSP